jgi:hypothetical protein
MHFIIYFHLQECNKNALISSIQKCSGITCLKKRRNTDDLLDNILADVDAHPTYLVINQSSTNWHSVECNSFKKLYEWGEFLSATLNTLFLQTVYSSVNNYAYLLAYEKGKKKREIESMGKSTIPLTNEGELFPFEESDTDGERANKLRMFDLESLSDFCCNLGIDLTCLQVLKHSTVLEVERSTNVMFNIERAMKQQFWITERETRIKNIQKVRRP